MKTQYKPVVEFITSRASLWQERCCLSHVKIEHVFLDAYYDESDPENMKVAASTTGQAYYLQATITWYLKAAANKSEEDLEWFLVHELSHVILMSEQAKITTKDSEAMELATELCTRAVMAGWKR